MTPEEFARLPAGAHHAVWQAHAQGLIDSVPASAKRPKGPQRYHRGQVLALLGEATVTRWAR
jgi:hypothetical protein